MVRPSKWISCKKPERPVSEFARRACEQRLRTVWQYAPLAAKDWQEDIEYVHQLRIATRRARAALEIFGDLLSKSERRWMQRRLRELRRAAGEARDLDVLGQRLAKLAEQQSDSSTSDIAEQIAADRRAAQKPLVAAYKKAQRKGFKKRSRSLCKSVRWRGALAEPTFAAAGRLLLSPLADEFFAAAEANLTDVEALHQMRICGKRVRYAMELLAGAFDDSFRCELYPTFAEVQEKLGTINDHATAIARFRDWCERVDYNGSRAELADLITLEEQQLQVECSKFREWWTSERAADLAERFAAALGVAIPAAHSSTLETATPTLTSDVAQT